MLVSDRQEAKSVENRSLINAYLYDPNSRDKSFLKLNFRLYTIFLSKYFFTMLTLGSRSVCDQKSLSAARIRLGTCGVRY